MEDLKEKFAEFLAKLPKPAEVEKYKALGALTPEEEHFTMKIIDKVGEINALTMFHPLINHQRIDPYIRKKVAELKEILPKIRTD